jgi:hypothetical protein
LTGNARAPPTGFITNVDGNDVELSRWFRIMRMWPAKHGCAGVRELAEGRDEGLLIPNKHEFKLAGGRS